MPSPHGLLPVARSALDRLAELLKILDQEHTDAQLYARMPGVRHELRTARTALAALAAPETELAATKASLAQRAAQASPVDPGLNPAVARVRSARPGSDTHRILLELAADGPLASFELEARLSMPTHTRNARTHELTMAGCLARAATPDGESIRRKAPSGSNQRLWEVTEAGRTALSRLNAGQIALFGPGA